MVECNGHTHRHNHIYKDLRSTFELKPENQDIDVPLTTDSTNWTPVTLAMDIMEQSASQSGATDKVTGKLKPTTILGKVTSHSRVVRAPTRLIETM